MKRTNLLRLLVAPSLCSAPVLLAGCTAGEIDEIPPPDTLTLIEDSRYMANLLEAKPDEGQRSYHNIDLSDDRQHRFVVNRLLASGNTPKSSPRLFELLAQARASAVASPPSRQEGSEPVGEASSAISADGCIHFAHLEERVNNVDTKYTPNFVVSCWDGAEYVYGDAIAYKTPDLEETSYDVIGDAHREEYNGGKNFTVTIPEFSFGSLANPNELLVLDSLAIAADQSTGIQQISYTTVKTVSARPNPLPNSNKYALVDGIQVSHPRNLINAQNDDPFYEMYKSWNYSIYPDQDAGGNRIRICLDRGYASALKGSLDCDYMSVQNTGTSLAPFKAPLTGIAAIDVLHGKATGELRGDPANYWPGSPYKTATRYMPVQGTFNLHHPDSANGCSIESYVPAHTQVHLVLAESGGFCNGGKIGDTENQGLAGILPAADGTTDTASFNTLAEFGGGCSWAPPKRIDAYITVHAKATGPAGLCGDRYASIKLGPIDFKKSCFAEGTGIRRADGTLEAVERLEVGERVVANSKGDILTITGIARGGEPRPLVSLYDEAGHDLLLTETHPVVTARRGIVPADAIEAGDEVLTERGVTTIVSVERVVYEGQVYNLRLGTPDELTLLGRENRTMFADGILVGDSEMQWEMESQEASAPEQPRPIPEAWRKDYENDRIRGALSAGSL